MSWDRVAEIFNVECSLEAGREESTERSDERGESSHDQAVDLEGGILDDWCGPSKLDHQYCILTRRGLTDRRLDEVSEGCCDW